MKKLSSAPILSQKYLVLIICVLSFSPQIIHGEASFKAHPLSKSPQKKMVPYKWYEHREWADEAWTGNDKPYQAVRTQIENALKVNPEWGKVLLAQCDTLRKKHPTSPLALFRWAYLRLSTSSTPDAIFEDGLDDVRNCFAVPPSPHTYNYTRLRYLLYQHTYTDERLIGIGARLLKLKPNDYPV